MAFNGSGVFLRLYNWTNDAAANIKIRADRMDNETNGIATGLSTCITKDGQTTITANLPMATFRHTGVGDGSARTDYASLGQSQDGKINWVDGGGTADAITAAYSPTLTALVDGQLCFVRATAANATTTPTFSPNGLTARTIVKHGGVALVAGDISGDNHELILRYNLASTRWELLNPKASGNVTTNGVQTLDNKTINPSCNATLSDTLFTLQDNSDTTKKFNFQLSGISTATTRTFTMPDYNGTFAMIAGRAYAEYLANTDLTTVIPYDDTIPQNTEGTEILTASITPKSTTSRIRVTVLGAGTVAVGSSQAILALFKDSDASALSATVTDISTAGFQFTVAIQFEHAPSTTSAITYKLRAGPNGVGAMRLNGTDAARRFGGVQATTMVVEEILT